MTKAAAGSAPRVAVVTGGAGFIGSALSHRLIAQGFTVMALDNLHPQIHPTGARPAELHPDAELVIGDVTDAQVWDELLAGVHPELIVHLAAETGTGQSLDQATRHGQVNVVGTTVMTDALLRHSRIPAQIILASSRAVYGEGQWETDSGAAFYPAPRGHAQLARAQWDCVPASGEPSHGVPSRAAATAPAPTSIYGATKLAQEHILRSWCLATGADLSILRLQNVYGPGQSLTNSYTGIVVLFTRMAGAGKRIPLYEDGAVVRDFVYIDDVADALAAAAAQPPAGGFRILDVGLGKTATIADLAETIAAAAGAPAPEVTGAFRDGDVRFATCDVTDTTADLGWRPEWDLPRGLAVLRDWVQGQETSG
ncbi:NAD-dependent epimerase/dehydratase family protein [Nakamurella sp.]|uniref:NAD-dependent epimerase/dehydratase family protein n=1 Tax=Nakamurella sp. TaxID=1869182 RepID=UPI0037846D92